MPTWQSKPIAVDGIEVQVQADANGVTLGKVHDGVYSSDLLLTPSQAEILAASLQQAARRAREA